MPLEVEVEARPIPALNPQARRLDLSAGALVFAVALPVLFLHASFQPTLNVTLSSTRVQLRLSDLVLVLVVLAAAVAGRREGFGVLGRGAPVWLASAAFLGFIFAATVYPLAWDASYPWKTHLVTAAKYAEYALLAPAVPLLLRRVEDLRALAIVIVGIGVAATSIGLLQFFGVEILHAWPSGGRQPSFVGVDDFGMLSAGVYAVAVAVVAFGTFHPSDRMLAWIAAVAGGLGMVLSGALASVLGALLATGAAALLASRRPGLSPRRLATLAAMAGAVLVGSTFMRSSALGSFANFLGLGQQKASQQVESYSHRWVLDYVGLKIFLRHPVLGAGWQAGYDEQTYTPVLPAAHRRFPSQPALAFPSPQHPWGIQNAYVEALAELGIVGALLFVAWIATGLAVGVRSMLRGPPGLMPASIVVLGVLWICVSVGVWNGLWFIAGIPFDVLIWLGFGLVASTAVSRQAAR